ncbi:MAG TPA: winged helix-turn-helix domain-containing protein [Solirubrobacterales bacterium]|jgi:DNA-binding transcriptional ArsR family regulator|nr:winged helix-turn-helix domain-containing protein [Solirubrobacterales bacterium]
MDAVEAEDGRLSAGLAATLEPSLHHALDHPFRREVLRILNRGPHPHSISELQAELPPFQRGQLSYHLRILREAGLVAAESNGSDPAGDHARYASALADDGRIRAVLRATERWDRQRREAMGSGRATTLLTMFRTPRPVRTIRLRGSGKKDGGRADE